MPQIFSSARVFAARPVTSTIAGAQRTVMYRACIGLAAGLALASVSLSGAAAQTAGGMEQSWTPEVRRACAKEASNWQRDVANGSDHFREFVFMACANNGGTMPGGPMPRQWYPN
jgi:hypothetical protein